jgi:CheY-like chemotaxis protein
METNSDRIIIIDAVPVEACIIEDVLLEAGFKNVRTYSDPLVALKDIGQHIKPAIVITDYHMPEMNGFDLAQKVLQRSEKTAIILISGDHEKAEELKPCFRVIKKDFSFYDRLLSCVSEILEGESNDSSPSPL